MKRKKILLKILYVPTLIYFSIDISKILFDVYLYFYLIKFGLITIYLSNFLSMKIIFNNIFEHFLNNLYIDEKFRILLFFDLLFTKKDFIFFFEKINQVPILQILSENFCIVQHTKTSCKAFL